MKTSDMQMREVIDTYRGRRLGYVGDLDVDFEAGRVRAIVVPGQRPFLSLFGGEPDLVIPWEAIVCLGRDVILVEFDPAGERVVEQLP